jgi:uncharacterized protein YjiS (DUF1127 family)
MVSWFRYYNTIIELMKLSDYELNTLGINREEIVYVAYKTHLFPSS